jgi:DNA-binding MarR family transcriptional regulator
MKISRHWKIASCLLAIVVVSGLAGSLIGHRVARRQLEVRNNPENWNEHVAREFDRIVKPTPGQGAKIQAILDQAVRELQAIRLDTIARSTNVIGRLVTDVDRELTPEQRKAFEVMKPRSAELTLEVLKVKPPAESKR